MKKGFTLVELSIVLVIIGLLAAMVIKGKNLVETSKVTREVALIKNLNDAFITYSNLYGTPKMLTIGGTDNFPWDPLIKSGFITKEDTKSFVGDHWYGPVKAIFVPKIGWEHIRGEASAGYKGDVYIVLHTIKDYNTFGGYGYAEIDTKLVCQLEKMIDDKNLYDGTYRLFNKPSLANFDYDNCNTHPNSKKEDIGVLITW